MKNPNAPTRTNPATPPATPPAIAAVWVLLPPSPPPPLSPVGTLGFPEVVVFALLLGPSAPPGPPPVPVDEKAYALLVRVVVDKELMEAMELMELTDATDLVD